MSTPRDLIYELGVNEVAAAIGRHVGRVRQAAGEDLLPAKWFRRMRDLAQKRGVVCDEDLFAFDMGEEQGGRIEHAEKHAPTEPDSQGNEVAP